MPGYLSSANLSIGRPDEGPRRQEQQPEPGPLEVGIPRQGVESLLQYLAFLPEYLPLAVQKGIPAMLLPQVRQALGC